MFIIKLHQYELPECWAVTKRDVHKIDALDQWCLRSE